MILMKKNIFKIFGLACVVAACVNEMPDNGSQAPSSGDAVNFVAGLGGSQTKTVYGEESADGKLIKVNWVENDLISVYGTNTAKGREQGTYKVTSVLTNGEGYSYAGDLQMTGDHGVQWGDGRSSFYAVYPSTSGKFESLSDGSGVTVPVSISGVQSNFFTLSNNKWTGVQLDSLGNKTMTDAIMYACNTGEDGDGLLSGATVNLQFKPFSTVLKFTLNGVGTPSGKTKVYINEIDVIAPTGTNISGTFPLTIKSNKTASAGTITNGSGTVIIKPYSIDKNTNETVNNIFVEADDIIEFCVFTVPQENLNLSGWKVRLVTSHGTKTFTISNATANVNAKLLAGQIHKVKVPALATLEDDFKFNPEEWIAQLPTAVYLSELSLPGSWYSTNTEDAYQIVSNGSTNLEGQYAAGVRAFNIDCRLSISPGYDLDDMGNKNYQNIETIDDFKAGKLTLACAGTEKEETEPYLYLFKRPTGKMTSIGKTVEQALIDLGELISKAENRDEFIVVVLSVSEKVKDHDGTASLVGHYYYGTVTPKLMLEAFANVLNKDSVKKYLYQDHITGDTTIEDVLGKIVVKINMNTSNENILTYAKLTDGTLNPNFKAPMMVSYGSMATSNNTDKGIVSGNFASYDATQAPFMICGHDYQVGSLRYHSHQANGTGENGQPTATQRQNIVKSILETAKTNYTSKPNVRAWYQLGIGGSYDGDYTGLATDMNKFMYQQVMEKMGYTFTQGLTSSGLIIPDTVTGAATGTPMITEANKNITPIGIVLMNQCLNTSCYGPKLIDAILTLNAKLKMEKAESTTPTPAPANNAAYAEVGEDAF